MKIKIYSLLVIAALFSPMAYSEVSIIVHPSNTNSFSKNDISRLFLGKSKSFPNGDPAIPIALNDDTANEFNQNLLGKSASQLKAYWAKLVFTGKATPPKKVSKVEMLELIKNNPNMIGYSDSSVVFTDQKVIGKY